MVVHPHANAFDGAAAEYERGRPGYPDALLDWIDSVRPLDAACTVVDLGAGTGKLTRLLVRSAARVIAIEPMAAMREVFISLLPDTELLDGTAEQMPLGSGSADLVTCGQSFRWFANEAALTEIARVLRPGGELLLVFNGDGEFQGDGELDGPGEASPLRRRLSEILKVANVETAEQKPGMDWREVLEAASSFALFDEVELPNPHFVDRAGLIDRLHSSSQFSRLPRERQDELIAELDTMISGDLVDLSQVTRVTALRRTN